MTDYEKAEAIAVTHARCIPYEPIRGRYLTGSREDLARFARIVAAVAFVRASGVGCMPVWPQAVTGPLASGAQDHHVANRGEYALGVPAETVVPTRATEG